MYRLLLHSLFLPPSFTSLPPSAQPGLSTFHPRCHLQTCSWTPSWHRPGPDVASRILPFCPGSFALNCALLIAPRICDPRPPPTKHVCTLLSCAVCSRLVFTCRARIPGHKKDPIAAYCVLVVRVPLLACPHFPFSVASQFAPANIFRVLATLAPRCSVILR